MRPARLTLLGALAAVGLLASACGSSGSVATTEAPGASSVASTTEAPQPAGKDPSAIAKMVCAPKAQGEIQRVLGVTAHVATPSWVDHLYSCRYEYPDGAFVLSVKELSSWPQTMTYFHSLGSSMGDTGPLGNLGQGAFTTSDGSVVVRKDWKVLLVDISPLPAQFGKPPTSRADVAYTVAALILGCWAGD
ncbi:MAG: hypothetical protein ACLQNG_08085 [Acidimicrobiales bacterium]